MKVLGVMTGTSCDGLDAACIDFNQSELKQHWSKSIAFPPALRKRVLAAQKTGTQGTSRFWLELDRDLGIWMAASLKKMIEKNSIKPDIIACHGQTIAHFPGAGKSGMTWQITDSSRIAFETGLTTVSHFRNGDVASGGQGAPLVPLFHRGMAQKLGLNRGVAIHNLGGVSNLTYIDPNWNLITRGKKSFDKDGALAKKGKVNLAEIHRMIKANPYFRKAPPKSTGRDDLQWSWFQKRTQARGLDLVATATALTVESIADAYERFILEKGHPLTQIILCGGGAKNKFLRELLRARLPEIAIRSASDWGWDDQLIEAQAFAYFGLLTLQGASLGGSWTGAAPHAPPGQIIPGKNWASVLKQL
jgi:anhydro-N-acetylmuramic acid kinase